MSNPKALGPTNFIASGVLSIGLAGSTTTPTLMPYRITSVVIGSPNRENINHIMHASIVKWGGRGDLPIMVVNYCIATDFGGHMHNWFCRHKNC